MASREDSSEKSPRDSNVEDSNSSRCDSSSPPEKSWNAIMKNIKRDLSSLLWFRSCCLDQLCPWFGKERTLSSREELCLVLPTLWHLLPEQSEVTLASTCPKISPTHLTPLKVLREKSESGSRTTNWLLGSLLRTLGFTSERIKSINDYWISIPISISLRIVAFMLLTFKSLRSYSISE